MNPICSLECEDCGKFIVVSPDAVSIFILDADEIYAIGRCASCDRVIRDDIGGEKYATLAYLLKRDIKIFNWFDGDLVRTETRLKELING